MTPEVAARRYLRAMRRAVKDIEERWQAGQELASTPQDRKMQSIS
jgi:hypothetical protein